MAVREGEQSTETRRKKKEPNLPGQTIAKLREWCCSAARGCSAGSDEVIVPQDVAN